MRPRACSTSLLLILLLALAGCGRPPDDYRDLQAKLAAVLGDPALCPAGTSADVRALIEAAGPDGVVRIPAGCYEITGSIGIPQGTCLLGAGMDQTILYRHADRSHGQDAALLWAFGRGEGQTQVSGIAFLGVRDTRDTGKDYGILFSNSRGFRVDHCYFEGFGFAGIRTEGTSSGVIDHSIFLDNFKEGIGNLGYGVAVYGDGRWADDPDAGTADAVFVEDSIFAGCRHAIASSGGAHYVFRYNWVRENVQACSVDAHGLGFGWSHGTRYVEIYGNTIEAPAYKQCGIGIRGGDGVIFGNTLRGFRNPVLLILEWGTPERLKAGYPASDQIRDLWIWDNDVQGGPAEPQVDREAKGFIVRGRDYYTQPKPGYEPYPYPHPLAAGGPFDSTTTSP